MKEDFIRKRVRERAKDFYYSSNIPSVKLENDDGIIKCKNCESFRWKLYTKFGGPVYGKRGKLMKDKPVIYNFICKCGEVLVLREGEFKYGRVSYGCSAIQCIYGKEKMDKKCLTCKYIYEK